MNITTLDAQPGELSVRFELTCFACPEQYDAFDEDTDQLIGYVRLRHGRFSVSPDSSSPDIFERRFPSDHLTEPEEEAIAHMSNYSDGVFENYDLRTAYLAVAARKIREYVNSNESS